MESTGDEPFQTACVANLAVLQILVFCVIMYASVGTAFLSY